MNFTSPSVSFHLLCELLDLSIFRTLILIASLPSIARSSKNSGNLVLPPDRRLRELLVTPCCRQTIESSYKSTDPIWFSRSELKSCLMTTRTGSGPARLTATQMQREAQFTIKARMRSNGNRNSTEDFLPDVFALLRHS